MRLCWGEGVRVQVAPPQMIACIRLLIELTTEIGQYGRTCTHPDGSHAGRDTDD